MLKAKNKTGLVFFPAFDWAIDPTHPEREERLLYTQDQVFEEGLFDIEGIIELKPDLVSEEDVQRTHFCVPGVSDVMTESHFISAGGSKNDRYLSTRKTSGQWFCPCKTSGSSCHANCTWGKGILQC